MPYARQLPSETPRMPATTGLVDSLEGILNGHKKKPGAHQHEVKMSEEEKKFLAEILEGTGHDMDDVVAVGFVTRDAEGKEKINAIYLTEHGVVDNIDLDVRRGYDKLHELVHGYTSVLSKVVESGTIGQIMSSYRRAEKRAITLNAPESEKRILIAFIETDTRPVLPAHGFNYFSRSRQNPSGAYQRF